MPAIVKNIVETELQKWKSPNCALEIWGE